MRSLHRWIMTPAAAVLLYLAVSGLLIQGVDLLALGRPAGRGSAATIQSIKEYAAGPPYFSVLSGVDEQGGAVDLDTAARQLTDAYAAALRIVPGAAITSLQLRVVGGVNQAVVVTGPDDARGRALVFDTATGALLANTPAQAPVQGESLHDAIKDWHRGNIAGITGVCLNFLAGASLLLLVFSGIWLYLQLWLRRSRLKRRAWFWS